MSNAYTVNSEKRKMGKRIIDNEWFEFSPSMSSMWYLLQSI
jgi:hypothetical protein